MPNITDPRPIKLSPKSSFRQRYLDAIESPLSVAEQKNQDYNSSVGLEAYFPFRDQSYVQELNKKGLRLVNLVSNPEQDINFESIVDTVEDLINYAVYYLMYLQDEHTL